MRINLYLKLQQKNIDDNIPFLQLFVDEVEDARAETLLLRKRLNIKIGIYVFILIAIGLVFFAMLQFQVSTSILDIYRFTGIFGGLFLLFQVVKVASSKKKLEEKYQQTFKNELYSIIISTLRPNWTYQNDFKFNIKNLVESDIFSQRVKIKNTDYCIESEFDLFPMKIYKIHAKVNNDEQSNSVMNYLGLFIKVNLTNTTNNRAIVAPRITSQNFTSNSFHKLNLHQKGYELHNESDLTFNRYFKIYNTQNYDLPEMLTPTLQRQLAHFVLNNKKEVYLSFQKDKLYISIKTDEITELPSLQGGVSTKHATEHFYNELQIALDLLKRLERDKSVII